MKTIPKGNFLGINNRLPDFALHVKDTGDFVRDAVNVDITDPGNIVGRKAMSLVQAVSGAHSLFGNYVVIGSTIYQVVFSPTYAQTLVKVLSSSAEMSWCQVGSDLYYSNGTDSGRFDESGSWYPWGLPLPSEPVVTTLPGGLPAGYYQVAVSHARYSGGTGITNLLEEGGIGPSNNYELTADGALRITLPSAVTGGTHINVYVSTQNGSVPMLQAVVEAGTATVDVTVLNQGRDAVHRYEEPLPAGHRVFEFNGRLCCLSGKVMYYGLPYRPGYYDPVGGRIPFPADTGIAIGNQSGVYVSADKTYFIAGADLEGEVVLRDVLSYGAVKGTEFILPSEENIVVGWFGKLGVVFADSQGQVTQVMADTVDQTPPVSGFSTVLTMGGYRRVVSCGWCVNTDNKAVTRYTDWATSVSGDYATKSDGIYLVDGLGPVNSVIHFGKENLGAENKKHMPAVYAGFASESPLELGITTPDAEDYRYESRSYNTSLELNRFDPGKGLRANWFDLSIRNIDGADFTLASLSFAPVASTRRI